MSCGVGVSDWDPPVDPDAVCCYGAVIYDRCTCWTEVFDTPPPVTHPGPRLPRPSMCDGCAYRPGTPAHDQQAEGLLPDRPEVVFGCHSNLRRVIAYEHPDGRRIDLTADDISHVGHFDGNAGPFDRDGHPAEICAGWAAHHLP